MTDIEQQTIESLKEELANHDLASKLIDAWCNENNSQISWGKAIEITAIVTKMCDVDRDRLLTMDEPDIHAELISLRQQLAELERWREMAFLAHPNIDIDIEHTTCK